ncbi:MAG: 30S ribosomal protein S18 [Methanoregulaceae archaeon]|nr:30S ribosomal protein S18 [Methanoregulaceae archaeon]
MSEDLKTGVVGARMDKDFAAETGGKFRGRKRRKVSYLTINKIEVVDYKDVNILRKFINDRGKMLPCRQTGNTAKQQRMIARAIRRARELALLPFVVTEMSADRREFTPRRAPREHGQGHGQSSAPAPVEAAPAAETTATE